MANNNSTTGGPVDEDSIPLSQLRGVAFCVRNVLICFSISQEAARR